MSREIKFRAWDEQAKSMVLESTKVMRPIGNLSVQANEAGYKLMQYTGLHDRNGVEIYEGDIVDAWSQGQNLKGVIKWGEGSAGFFIKVPPPVSIWNLSGPTETLEVIGNVHQNPDLLA